MWGKAVSPEGKEVAIPHDTESQQDLMKSSLKQAHLDLFLACLDSKTRLPYDNKFVIIL